MRRVKAWVGGLGLSLTLTGCGLLGNGVYETDLPGGADLGKDPITITADFTDVLDLVPQSSVKVDNVEVGQVSRITLNKDGRSARVELTLNRSAELPEGTTARLQQTSLLGEKYVALLRPASTGAAPLEDGEHLGVAATSQAAEVEQVLGSLSLVLNGGGVEQFQTISRELQAVSAGRPEQIKGFLRQLNTFVGGLDDRKEALTATLDGLDRLGATLVADKDKIITALEELSPGMQVLVDQREDLVKMLSALDRLSDVTVDTLNAAQADIVADFEALRPILDQLAEAGDDLPQALQILLTYPFPDAVLGAIRGDYFNVFVTTNFSTPANCGGFACNWPQPADGPGANSVTPRVPRVAPGLEWDDHPELGPDPGPSQSPTGPTSSTPSPTLLRPTDTAVPGLPSPTLVVPTRPSDSPTSSPTLPSAASSATAQGGE
ncbi:MCE family protein [Nocardioides daejeonensis]|uniref:MCE family protein n=1 Tax=Nocardioides daejeonensis TaxID=1046556 RepID=UPI000D74172D|nr:MCE family protein [Nocardioides daejeonensis]